MRVQFACEEGATAFSAMDEGVDLLLFGMRGLGEVSYERELKGETEDFARVAKLSKSCETVVCGCVTNTRGHRRKSAIVAQRGKLVGVSDMVCTTGEYDGGAEYKLYETAAGKMGVLVGEELRFFSAIQAMVACGCDYIVCPYEGIEELTLVLARAAAYAYGVPLLLCGEGGGAIADPSGAVVFSTPVGASTAYQPQKAYEIVEYRKRGGR